MKRLISILAVLLSVNVVQARRLVAESKFVTDSPETVVDFAANSGVNDRLSAAIAAAGLETVLAGEGPFTLFAPINRAFASLDIPAEELLTSPDLNSTLMYHVLNGSILRRDFNDGEQLETMNGAMLNVTVNSTGVFLNDAARILRFNAETRNGVVHVIDGVLRIPPSGNDAKSDEEEAAVIEEQEVVQVLDENEEVVDNEGMAAQEDLEQEEDEETVANQEEVVQDSNEQVIEDEDPGEEQRIEDKDQNSQDVGMAEEQEQNDSGIEANVPETTLPDEADETVANQEEVVEDSNEQVIEDEDPDEEQRIEVEDQNSQDVGTAEEQEQNEAGIEADAPKTTLPDEDAPLIPTNVVEVLRGSGFANTLVASVTAANIESNLLGEGPFTIFAPTDEAFAKTLTSLGLTAEELLASPDLASILNYHVVPGTYDFLSVDLKQGLQLETLNGAPMTLSTDSAGTLYINDVAEVLSADIEAGNGVVRFIDTVLLPPTSREMMPPEEVPAQREAPALEQEEEESAVPILEEDDEGEADEGEGEAVAIPETVVDVLADSGFTDTFAAAISAAGVERVMSVDGPFTVFAPVDDAFGASDVDSEDLLSNPDLNDIVSSHVVRGKYLSGDLEDGQQLKTVTGSILTVTVRGQTGYINNARVVGIDFETDNGVVHFIDTVLGISTHEDQAQDYEHFENFWGTIHAWFRKNFVSWFLGK